MRVTTGQSSTIRDAVGQQSAPEFHTALLAIASACTLITDPRRSVFIEIRERGVTSVVARSLITAGKGKVHFGRSGQTHFGGGGVERESFVECWLPPKESRLSIKLAKLSNVCTPYVLDEAQRVRMNPKLEVMLSSVDYVIYTDLEKRKQFAHDVYAVALASGDAIHKMASLKAMEQLFIAKVSHGEITKEAAEKAYDRYDKLNARIWRGATPGEQSAAFRAAWRALAKATGIVNGEAAE